jgi:glycosyltransferase involved in cell wall biosynthesis
MYSAQNKSDYEVIKKCEISSNIAVSICIVSYNVEEYIEKCLDSVCQQTFQKIEIIIVDDMSTDGTREKLYKFAKKMIMLH